MALKQSPVQGKPRENFTVILNPKSGSVDSGTKTDLRQTIEKAGVSHKILEMKEGVDGEKLAGQAIKQGARHLIASGGDGTVMAVMNAILKSGEDVLLSVSPGGTANLIAAALEIPTSVEESVQVALYGRECRIDVGKTGDRYFALGIGIGLAEKLVSGTDDAIKDRIGRLAYAWAALKNVGAKPGHFKLIPAQGDAQDIEAVGIVIANVGGIGDRLKFAPDAKIDDGLLDICVLHRLGFLDAARLAVKVMFGGLEDDRAVSYLQWPSVTVESQGHWPVQIDGEDGEFSTPLKAEAIRNALRLTVPSSS
jgi:diacylglycerol kinase (ATP)